MNSETILTTNAAIEEARQCPDNDTVINHFSMLLKEYGLSDEPMTGGAKKLKHKVLEVIAAASHKPSDAELLEAVSQVLDDMDCMAGYDAVTDAPIWQSDESKKTTACCIAARNDLQAAYVKAIAVLLEDLS